MAAWSRLSIDIDGQLLARGAVREGKRAKKFIDIALRGGHRTFRPSWTEEVLDVKVSDGTLLIDLGVLQEIARPGDRLVLWVHSGRELGDAELIDGAAAIVQHIMDRADPHFVATLAREDIPGRIDGVIDRAGRDHRWTGLMEAALATAVDLEARGVAALVGVGNWFNERDAILELMGPAEALVRADALAEGMLASRRMGRAAEDAIQPAPSPRRVSYQPRFDARQLFHLLDAANRLFETDGAGEIRDGAEKLLALLGNTNTR